MADTSRMMATSDGTTMANGQSMADSNSLMADEERMAQLSGTMADDGTMAQDSTMAGDGTMAGSVLSRFLFCYPMSGTDRGLILLPVCYTMSGIDIGLLRLRYAMSDTDHAYATRCPVLTQTPRYQATGSWRAMAFWQQAELFRGRAESSRARLKSRPPHVRVHRVQY